MKGAKQESKLKFKDFLLKFIVAFLVRENENCFFLVLYVFFWRIKFHCVFFLSLKKSWEIGKEENWKIWKVFFFFASSVPFLFILKVKKKKKKEKKVWKKNRRRWESSFFPFSHSLSCCLFLKVIIFLLPLFFFFFSSTSNLIKLYCMFPLYIFFFTILSHSLFVSISHQQQQQASFSTSEKFSNLFLSSSYRIFMRIFLPSFLQQVENFLFLYIFLELWDLKWKQIFLRFTHARNWIAQFFYVFFNKKIVEKKDEK